MRDATDARTFLALVLPAERLAALDALSADLPAPTYAAVLALLVQVEDDAYTRGMRDTEALWGKVVAHLPGIAPALNVLYWHVCGGPPRCSPTGDACPVQPSLMANT
ncbi:MAG TPA: hypothetical protein VII06_43125 [Chloroflexota bacterium]|jgi:hypothetical protein